jgi:hypothetical protein
VAAVLTALFVVYLSYSRRVAPDRSCGCLSGAHLPVSRRALLRAALLCAAAVLGLVLGLAGSGFWAAEMADRPMPAVAVLALEGLAVAALSPELRWGGLRRARWVSRAGRGGPDCAGDCGVRRSDHQRARLGGARHGHRRCR